MNRKAGKYRSPSHPFVVWNAALAILALMAGCNLNIGKVKSSLSVSVIGSAGTRSSSSTINKGTYIKPITDESYFKTDRKAENRGSLVGAFNPEEFILDLDRLKLYRNSNGTYHMPDLLGFITNPLGNIIPRHINIIHANRFIRDISINSDLWNGISLQFLPFADYGSSGNSIGGSNDGFKVNSVVGVRLASDYDNIRLRDELPRRDSQDPDLHFFSINSLQPFSGRFLSYLIIGSDIENPGIQNPDGLMPNSVGETSWTILGGETTGNATALFLKGPQIDFRPYTNPDVVLTWDMNELVQVWDARTGNRSDDIVTFNLSNPFPVTLSIREAVISSAENSTKDTIPPGPVIFESIAGPNTWNTLQWVNPADPDFDKVVIIRKTGSAPIGINDGEKVYDGYEPNYVDTTGKSGSHYYYMIYAVDSSGNHSESRFLDQVQR